MNNREREQWVNNDEGLYNWWKGSRVSMRKFITDNRIELDRAINRSLGRSPARSYEETSRPLY